MCHLFIYIFSSSSFRQSCGFFWWRVCYQWGLPHLVLTCFNWLWLAFNWFDFGLFVLVLSSMNSFWMFIPVLSKLDLCWLIWLIWKNNSLIWALVRGKFWRQIGGQDSGEREGVGGWMALIGAGPPGDGGDIIQWVRSNAQLGLLVLNMSIGDF